MRCPRCLAVDRMVPVPSLIPFFLFPLRLFVGSVQCDSCLHYFYRERLFGWMIRSRAPEIVDEDSTF
jgi:hypothetical protein